MDLAWLPFRGGQEKGHRVSKRETGEDRVHGFAQGGEKQADDDTSEAQGQAGAIDRENATGWQVSLETMVTR